MCQRNTCCGGFVPQRGHRVVSPLTVHSGVIKEVTSTATQVMAPRGTKGAKALKRAYHPVLIRQELCQVRQADRIMLLAW